LEEKNIEVKKRIKRKPLKEWLMLIKRTERIQNIEQKRLIQLNLYDRILKCENSLKRIRVII
jgi:hypothetical protein